MSRFLESIAVVNGKAELLDYHQDRVDRTCAHFFGDRSFRLADVLPFVSIPGTFKVRVLYDQEAIDIEFVAYQKRPVTSIQILEAEQLDYRFKYANRSFFDEVIRNSPADDVIITQEGKVTDSTYANLAFYDGKKWHTPDTPLLKGVRRTRLLDEKRLVESSISVKDLQDFEKVSLVNAMLDLGEVNVPISALI